MTQKKAAEKLGLIEAAVSRYISGKIGYLEMPNGEIRKEIIKSVDKLMNGENTTVVIEMYRICDILKSAGVIDSISNLCSN